MPNIETELFDCIEKVSETLSLSFPHTADISHYINIALCFVILNKWFLVCFEKTSHILHVHLKKIYCLFFDNVLAF